MFNVHCRGEGGGQQVWHVDDFKLENTSALA